jgi:hypothetical protein
MTTHWQDKFSEWLGNLFGFNKEEESFVDKMQIDTLKEKGFHYNEEEDCWERVWVVATRDGSERSREVYKQGEDGWKVVMYGDKGNIFFEHGVDGT